MVEQNQAANPPQATPPVRKAARRAIPSQLRRQSQPIPARRSHKRLILLASLAVLVVGGVFLWMYFSRFELTDDAQVDVHLYPVSARISGYVQKVNVEDNQWVEQGSTRGRNRSER